MKKFVIPIVTAFALSGFTGLPVYKAGITGLIDPVDGAKKIWAFSGNDSIYTVPQSGGKFSMDVKAGSWNLLIQAVPPLKDVTLNNVVVLETQPTDVGLITLKENQK